LPHTLLAKEDLNQRDGKERDAVVELAKLMAV
jgi:hypothetical protein